MTRIQRAIVFSLCLVGFVLAVTGFSRGAEVSEPNSYVFDLEYNERGQSLQVDLNQWLDRASFEKEPDFSGRKVVKGLIPAGAEEKDYIGYAWDVSAGKLFLDLNRNRDLTDDPNGVFETDRPGRHSYFGDVRFTVKSGLFELPFVAPIRF